jgi:hypothetical protein
MKIAKPLVVLLLAPWLAAACGEEDDSGSSSLDAPGGAAGVGARAGAAGAGAGAGGGTGGSAVGGAGGVAGTCGGGGALGYSAGAAGASGAGTGGTAGAAGSGVGGAPASGGFAGSSSGNGGMLPGGNGGAGASAGGGGGAGTATSCATTPGPTGPDVWRSVYFPTDWLPVHAGGKRDGAGRALPDFSYAGYHQGLQKPPVGQGKIVATVDAKLGDGKTDATAALQATIDAACKAGGGVVVVPAGTYKLTMPSGKNAALSIGCSALVLRGEGVTTRLLFDDATDIRGKSVLGITGGGTLLDGSGTTTYPLAVDAPEVTDELALTDTGKLKVGDWIVVRSDVTDGFRADHRMDQATSKLAALWPADQFRGLIYPRKIKAIAGKVITLDEPTRYPLKMRDNARVYAMPKTIEEVGVESLALGMVESKAPSTSATDENKNEDDYTLAGKLGYDVHASSAISLGMVHDAWLHDVSTFAPVGNSTGVHVLSHGVVLSGYTFRVQITETRMGKPQYRGGGGNGYAYSVLGHDNLLVDSVSDQARHGITLNNGTSGNVFLRMRMVDTRYANDTHRFLSHENLFDQTILDGGWLQSVNRGTTSSGAGFTGTRLVYWNTEVRRNHPTAKGCAIESAQFGDGYLIGSRAAVAQTAKLCPQSFTNGTWKTLDSGAPVDFVEGEGKSDWLDPPSLYEAQLAKRVERQGLACPK